MPAILSKEESRVDFGIAKETLIVSPSLAPASSNSSFGIITAMEFPTLLIFPVNTRDITPLLRNNYISLAFPETRLCRTGVSVKGYELAFDSTPESPSTILVHALIVNQRVKYP
jgi:hypothetical protein